MILNGQRQPNISFPLPRVVVVMVWRNGMINTWALVDALEQF